MNYPVLKGTTNNSFASRFSAFFIDNGIFINSYGYSEKFSIILAALGIAQATLRQAQDIGLALPSF